MTTSNSEIGMLSDAERYSWASYYIFVIVSSLIGDSIILYASNKRGAFHLNAFIVTIMQHIAVTDLDI